MSSNDSHHSDQPGLRLRLQHEARRIATQHGHLDALESTTLRALERGDAHEMAEALRAFAGALESHFSLEEQVHFPALHGLDASHATEILDLVAEHRGFHETLEALRAHAAAGTADGLRPELLAGFGSVAAALRQHEEREEQLFARAVAR